MNLQVRWGGRATLERSAAALRDPVWGVWFGRLRHRARSTGLFCSGAEAPRPALRASLHHRPGLGAPLSGLRSPVVRAKEPHRPG